MVSNLTTRVQAIIEAELRAVECGGEGIGMDGLKRLEAIVKLHKQLDVSEAPPVQVVHKTVAELEELIDYVPE